MNAKAKLETFVLTLEDAQERQQSVKNQCSYFKLPFQFIYGIDFRNKNDLPVADFYQPTEQASKKNKLLSNTEIACSLSHQKIYQHIIEQQIPLSLILEDDFEFIESPLPLIENIANIQQETQFDVLILGYVKLLEKDLDYHYTRIPIKNNYHWSNYQFGKPWEQFSCGTVAYFITLEGAKKLIQHHPIRVTADNWLYFEQYFCAKIVHLRPFIALEACNHFDSTIRIEQQNHLAIKKSSYFIRSIKGRIKNLLMNYLRFK